MGWQASWVAVKGADTLLLLENLALVETGGLDFGDRDGDYLSYAELPSGWLILASGAFDFVTPERMGIVSVRADAVGCRFWETVMVSEAWGFQNGEQVWSVTHDSQVDPKDLQVVGSPPVEFEAVRDRLLGEQAAHADEPVDYIFEIPSALTKAVCGFGPDAGVVPPETVFKILEPLRSGAAGKRQAAERALRDRLTEQVVAELFPYAESLGFERVSAQSEFNKFYRRGAFNALVRQRGDRSESLEIFWGLGDGQPGLAIDFFVRSGSKPRYGRSGHAAMPSRRRGLLSGLFGPKPDPHAAISGVIAEGRQLLGDIDRFLTTGVASPHVRPPEYRDDIQAAT